MVSKTNFQPMSVQILTLVQCVLVTPSVPALCAGCEQTLNYPILRAYDFFLPCYGNRYRVSFFCTSSLFYQSLKCWYRDSLLCCTGDYTAH